MYGQSVTLTATVTARFGGTPNGTMTFKDGANILATVPCSGKCTLITAKLTTGSHSITAAYSGSPSYLSSTSTAAVVSEAGDIQYSAPILSQSFNAGDNRNFHGDR
jgi:hypothetical protein